MSNHSSGLSHHLAKSCKANKKETPKVEEDNSAPANNQKKTKKVDTKLMYEMRQNGLSDFGAVKI